MPITPITRITVHTEVTTTGLGPVARSLVSANRWLRGIKMYRFPWYLTLVSTNHASSNPGLDALECKGTLGLGGTELGKLPDDWHEGESGEEGLEEDDEVAGFEEWRVGASEELRIKLYKSGMRCIIKFQAEIT